MFKRLFNSHLRRFYRLVKQIENALSGEGVKPPTVFVLSGSDIQNMGHRQVNG